MSWNFNEISEKTLIEYCISVWPNSPTLNVSLKNLIFFHLKSLKLGEVLVHIDNYKFTNFH